MSEQDNKELEFYERRLQNLEHTVYGNGRKGIKDELIELRTEIQTFRKVVVWQIGIAVAILAALLKIIL